METFTVDCYYHSMSTVALPARRIITSRVIRNGDEPRDRDWLEASPSERMAAVWWLTEQCLAWKHHGDNEPRLQRSVVHIQRKWR